MFSPGDKGLDCCEDRCTTSNNGNKPVLTARKRGEMQLFFSLFEKNLRLFRYQQDVDESFEERTETLEMDKT